MLKKIQEKFSILVGDVYKLIPALIIRRNTSCTTGTYNFLLAPEFLYLIRFGQH